LVDYQYAEIFAKAKETNGDDPALTLRAQLTRAINRGNKKENPRNELRG
jgi:hypothetical protein